MLVASSRRVTQRAVVSAPAAAVAAQRSFSAAAAAAAEDDALLAVHPPSKTPQMIGTRRHVSASGGIIATVFGCTGQVARVVVGRLGRVGAQVVLPYRGEERYVRHLKVVGEVGQTVPYRFDTFKNTSPEHLAHMKKAVANSNVVINLIGRDMPTRNFSIKEANVDTAEFVAKLCAEAGVSRLIHMSSVGASPKHPSAVVRAKYEAEQKVKRYFPDATILRLSQVFGPEDRFLNKFGFLLSFTHKYLPVPFPQDKLIQPVSVRDVATAVMNAIAEPESIGKTYEIGGPQVMRMEHLLEDIVFRHSRTPDGQTVRIPAALAALSEKIQRKPFYTAHEADYYSTDNIVNHNMLKATDLGLDERISIDEVAVNLLRRFRDPNKFFDLVNSKF